MDNAISLLRTWTESNQIPWHPDADAQFSEYIRLLLHAQKQTNLTGFSTPEDIVRNLFIDSLQILRTNCIHDSIIDVGTGAGFPAIPIKILIPELEITLVEPRTKRYAFLRQVERALCLSNISIHKARIESVQLEKIPAVAISKAFAPLPQWLEITKPWAQSGTLVACLISRSDWDNCDIQSFGYSLKSLISDNNRIYAVLSAC